MTYRHFAALAGPRDTTRWQGMQTIIDRQPRRGAGARALDTISDNKGTTT
jgi:hypothetical protein